MSQAQSCQLDKLFSAAFPSVVPFRDASPSNKYLSLGHQVPTDSDMFFARISPSRVPYLGQRISQRYLMSPTSQFSKEPLTLGTMLRSDSGRTYKIEEILADRRKPLLCVYRARCINLEMI